jgi:outer membrane protein TolC
MKVEKSLMPVVVSLFFLLTGHQMEAQGIIPDGRVQNVTAGEKRQSITADEKTQNLTPDGKLSFDQAIEMMNRNSHTLRQAEFYQKEKDQAVLAAKSLYLPTVGMNASYLAMSKDISLDLTPVRDAITPLYSALSNYGNFSGVPGLTDDQSTQVLRSQMASGLKTVQNADWDPVIQKKLFGSVSATAQWPVYTGGKIKAANQAALIGQKEAAQVFRQKNGELMSELAERYFGLCLAKQAVVVRQEAFDGMERHLQDALKMEKQGLIAHADVLNAQVYHAQAERELSKARHTEFILNQALLNTLAANEDITVDPVTRLFYMDTIEPVSYFKDLALKNNPLLQQVNTKKLLAEQGYNAEKAELYPMIAMEGLYNVVNKDLSPYMPTWMVGLGAKWTLFDGSARNRKIKEASFKTDQVKEAEQKAQSDVTTVIDKLYRELEMYQEQLSELASASTFAEEYLRVREKAFTEEMTNATDVTDARLALSKVKIERLEAMYGYDLTLARILEYAGIPDQFPGYQKKKGVIMETYKVK